MAPTNTSSGDQGSDDNENGNTGGAGDQNQSNQGGNDNSSGDGDLGDAGKKALEAERNSRRMAEKKARELEAELAKIRESSMSETEKAIAQAKREASSEAEARFNARLIQAEVRAVAAGKLADPEDAIRFLDLDLFKVDSDGNVDTKAVAEEIKNLLKTKPYLAASATRPTGDADQGARGGQSGTNGNNNDWFLKAVKR